MSGGAQTGIDVGGTFTDLAAWDGVRLTTAKVPTTPADQSRGVLDALEAAHVIESTLVHGTTVATNALLERTGAAVALVTDAGFEDLIEIGRQDRPSLYDVARTRSVPLAGSALRFGVPGRDRHDAPAPAVAETFEEVAAAVAASSPGSVAVSTLFSFLYPGRERALRDTIRRALPGVVVSISSDVAPEFREYERTSTTVINAYLQPLVERYLLHLGEAVGAAGVVGSPTVMRSSGGLIGLEEAARLPASIVLSGPAGGVVAAGAYGAALGRRSVVSFDMGGTSTDVCRITDGRPQVAFERSIDGLPNRMPSVAIHTVGAGGGSIAWIDTGGALRVGPQSAGAVPGPAAYGRGGNVPTVTDADLLIGRLGVDGPLSLDREAALGAIAAVGESLGMNPFDVARGIVEVVEAHMERAVRVVSVEEGSDPRSATLIAFGGAGAMHATALARRLDMAGVVVPPHAGVFSALGLLLAPPRTDLVRGLLLEPGDDLDGAVQDVLQAGREGLMATGTAVVDVAGTADVRYRGQAHETSVEYVPGEGWDVLVARFHEAHRVRNGFARPGDPVEVVAVRAAAVGAPALSIDELPAPAPSGDPLRGRRPVLIGKDEVDAAVWWRPGLGPGSEVVGPAVIEEPEATTWIGPGERAVMDDLGAIEVEW